MPRPWIARSIFLGGSRKQSLVLNSVLFLIPVRSMQCSNFVAETRTETRLFREFADELLASGVGFRFEARGRSMLPAIGDGDILHVKPMNVAKLKLGDIVLFRSDAEFKAHRIVKKRGRTFVTRGDAGMQTDGSILADQIIGQIVASESARRGVSHYGRQERARFFLASAKTKSSTFLRKNFFFSSTL